MVYGNSGCWLDGSHLVVRREEGTRRLATAELRVWRNGGVSILRRVDVPEPAKQLPPAPERSAAPADTDAAA